MKTLIDGRVEIEGICEEGGERLIDSEGAIQIAQISPNPAFRVLLIDLEIQEKARTELKITNSAGQLIDNRIIDTSQIGMKNLEIDLSNYSNGNYLITLITPTLVITENFKVAK